MTNRESFMQIWAGEAAVTQRILAAVPEKNHGYKPDPKARSGLELAAFVAMHGPILQMLLETGEVKGGPASPPASAKEVGGMFSGALPGLEKKLKGVDDKSWDTKIGKLYGPNGQVFQTAPIGALAWFTLFDLIHHRGQLSTYLRPMGGKVPSIYGPSADDAGSK